MEPESGDCGTGSDGSAGSGRDRLRWPRRGLAWLVALVALVALGCGWQVLPERVVRLYEFGKNQYARSPAAAPLPTGRQECRRQVSEVMEHPAHRPPIHPDAWIIARSA